MNPDLSVLHVFHDPPLDGPTNMARDEHLLHSPTLRPASLRLYAWSPPTISLGYFQRYDDVARLPAELRGLAVVRRPTGGGAILHDQEITYCLAVDGSLAVARRAPAALYRLVHEAWRVALATDRAQIELAPESWPFPSPRSGPFFCFQKPGQTDLIIGQEKLLGSAQRRIPGRVLQHGSLLLGRRFAAHPGAHLDDPPAEVVDRWTAAFVAALATALELEPRPATWTGEQLADVERRRQRYAGDDWTRRR
jgi:lipoate-protein ligase A